VLSILNIKENDPKFSDMKYEAFSSATQSIGTSICGPQTLVYDHKNGGPVLQQVTGVAVIKC
jgi:hypothetical protein